MNSNTLGRILLMTRTMREIFAEDEKVNLEDVARKAGIPFITLISDLRLAIEQDIIGFSFLRYYNVNYTHYVKRYTKSKGKTFKPVNYFGKDME